MSFDEKIVNISQADWESAQSLPIDEWGEWLRTILQEGDDLWVDSLD